MMEVLVKCQRLSRAASAWNSELPPLVSANKYGRFDRSRNFRMGQFVEGWLYPDKSEKMAIRSIFLPKSFLSYCQERIVYLSENTEFLPDSNTSPDARMEACFKTFDSDNILDILGCSIINNRAYNLLLLTYCIAIYWRPAKCPLPYRLGIFCPVVHDCLDEIFRKRH